MDNFSAGKYQELPGLLQQYYALAEQQKHTRLSDYLTVQSQDLHEETRRLTVIGNIQPALLNQLLGQSILKQSLLLLTTTLEIKACQNGEPPYALQLNQRHPITDELIRLHQRDIPLQLFVANEWLREYNITINLRPFPETLIEDQFDLLNLFTGTDLVLFLTDAQVILTRVEAHFLHKCDEIQIPFLLGVTRLDLADPAERPEIIDYVRRFVNRYTQEIVILADLQASPDDPVHGLFGQVETAFSKIDLTTLRFELFLAKFLYCLLDLRNTILYRHEQLQEKIQLIKEEEDTAYLAIKRSKDQWMQIENELTEKRQATEQLLRLILSENRKRSVSNLLIELERSNDAKLSWEKYLVHSINRELQSTTERIDAVLQKQIGDIRQWLYQAVFTKFQYKPELQKLPEHLKDIPDYRSRSFKLMNTQRFRMGSRLGNAATILGAGALLVGIPLGGLVMATSIVYQAVMDQRFHNIQKKEKELLRPELLKVMEKLELQLLKAFSNWLKLYFENIVTNLKINSQNWHAAVTQATRHKAGSAMAAITDQDPGDALDKLNAILAKLI